MAIPTSGARSGPPPTPPVPPASGDRHEARDGGPSRRQARAVATRERIIEAAAADFSEVGYHGSSLARILERGHGVTKGALYFHFSSKEAMALAVVTEMEAAWRDLVTASAVRDADRDPLRRAVLLALGVQDLLAASPVVRAGERLALEGAAGPAWLTWPTRFWQETFTALFAEAQQRGDVRAEVDTAAMGGFVCDISHGAFASSLALTGLEDLATRVSTNWEVMFGYMACEAWLEGWRSDGGMASAMASHLPARASTDVAGRG